MRASEQCKGRVAGKFTRQMQHDQRTIAAARDNTLIVARETHCADDGKMLHAVD